jgi:hypothetical protein
MQLFLYNCYLSSIERSNRLFAQSFHSIFKKKILLNFFIKETETERNMLKIIICLKLR